MRVWSRGGKDPLEQERTIHSTISCPENSMTEESRELQSRGCKESGPTECTPVRLEKIHHELSVHTALCSGIKMTGMPTAVEMGNLVVCRAEGGHVRISMCLECPTKDPYPYLWPLRVARIKTSYQKETKWKQFRYNHVNSCEHTSARFSSVSKLVSLPRGSSRYYYS